MASGSQFLGIYFSGGIDEKSIPASEIEVSWAIADYIPHSVPN
jgi:hypothetical protein